MFEHDNWENYQWQLVCFTNGVLVISILHYNLMDSENDKSSDEKHEVMLLLFFFLITIVQSRHCVEWIISYSNGTARVKTYKFGFLPSAIEDT